MSSNDLDTTTNAHTRAARSGEAHVPGDERWSSWIDPSDSRDSRRIDTTEVLRSELHVVDSRLQTTEELAAVNARLRARVVDLCQENDDMNAMIDGTGIATIFLDRRLRVVRFTPAAREIGYDRMADVLEYAQTVRDTLCPKQTHIQATGGRWYRVYVHPYCDLDDVLQGVVISFFDVTEHRIEEEESARRLSDKETMLKEVHHRVRTNTASIVGLLSIQARSIVDSEARSVLKGAIGRVESMSVLYDKLLVSKRYGASSVKGYLEDLARRVVAFFPAGAHTTLDTRIADFDVKSDDLFLLGLITNELLTNAMKYAFEGRQDGSITLGVERSENRVTLTVQDDGAGLPPGFDPETNHGFGLSLVRMLSKQLGGKFSLSTRNGTRGVLEFMV